MFDRFKRAYTAFAHLPIPDEPPKGEQAVIEEVAGLFQGGKAFELWRGDELKMRRGNGIYKQMLIDDQISASILLMDSAIVGRRFRFEVDDPEQQKMADVFEYNLSRTMTGTIKELIQFMLWARVEGFSVVEKVFGTFEFDNKEWWGLDSFKLRPNDTLVVKVDEHGNRIALEQDQGITQLKELDLARFIYYVHQPRMNAHYGHSDLRAAYDHYWAKLNIYKFWNTFVERAGGGFAVAKIEGQLETGERDNLRAVLKNLQNATSLTIPKNVSFEFILPKDPETFSNAIQSRNMSIARALLVPSLLGFGEETSTGSQARAKIQMEAWWLILDSVASSVADTLNEQLFRQLAWWNFGTLDYPLFTFEALTQEQKDRFAKQWIEAVDKGVVVNTFEDESRMRDMLHFSSREEEDLGLPQQVPSPGQPANQEIPPGSNPLETATAGLASALEDRKPNLRPQSSMPQHLKFEHRTDFTAINQTLYQDVSTAFGVDTFAAIDDVWNLFVDEMLADDPWTLDTVNRIKAPDNAMNLLQDALQRHIPRAFDLGRFSAFEDINVAKADVGLEPLRSVENPKPIDQIAMSLIARYELESKDYALDLETAEQYLDVKILEMVGHIVNDQMLAAVKFAIINGLRTEQSIQEMINSAMAVLEPIIGKRDSNGNVITPINLSTRVKTLVRTSLTEAFNEGRRTFFEDPELDGFVEAYQYSAVLDDRTTEFCKTSHGRIWSVQSQLWRSYVPPNHFNCRSQLIPVVQGDQWTESQNVPVGINPSPGFG